MADEKQQKTSQRLEKADNSQQQQQDVNNTGENSTTDNSRQFGYVPEDSRKIYIGGLKEKITKKDLSEHFGQFGEIQCIDVKLDIVTGRDKGYAFVLFKTMEGMDNALACKNHVINDMKIEPKKPISRPVRLFVGRLSPDSTYDDIIEYFKKFAQHVKLEMPLNRITNLRKSYCFITIENFEAVTEILRLPRHVINGQQVNVSVAEIKLKDYRMTRVQRNVMDQGSFLPQSGYTPYAPSYHYGGYGYYTPQAGYMPNYHYSYGYPIDVARAGASNQSQGD